VTSLIPFEFASEPFPHSGTQTHSPKPPLRGGDGGEWPSG